MGLVPDLKCHPGAVPKWDVEMKYLEVELEQTWAEREAFLERQAADGEELLGLKVSIRWPELSTAAA